jgi:PAS domain S-box-containing protein
MSQGTDIDSYLSLDTLPGVGTYVWLAAEDRLLWSPQMVKLYGLTQTPAGEPGFLAFVHPEDRVRVEAETAAMLGSGSQYVHEFRIVRADGAVRRIHDRGVIQRNGSGAAVHIAGINIDVTDTAFAMGRGDPLSGSQARLPQTAARLVDDIRRTGEPLLQRLVEQAPAAFAMVDADMRYLFVSRRFRADFGLADRPVIGHCHYDLPPETTPALRQAHARALAGETISIEEEFHPASGGTPDWIRWTMSPWRTEAGSIGGAILISEVVTERVMARQALAESQARLADALRAGGLGIHDFDPRSGRIIWDTASRALWGIPEGEEVTYDTFVAGVHPDDLAAVDRAVSEALDPSGPGRYEATYRVRNRQTGAVRWVRADGVVTFERGAAARLVGTVSDVTERKVLEEHVQLLLAEVSHRSKNLLNVVQAIARQTASGDPATFMRRFDQRLASLAASQDLLLANDGRGVAMDAVIRAQLEHFQDSIGTRIRIEGPPVTVTAAASQTLGMALHELATNAAKYGSLSTHAGEVRIGWSLAETDSRRLTVEWCERGGPPVRPPSRKGFGSAITGRLTEAGLKGEVSLDYAPEGLVWRVLCGPDCVVDLQG